eukprot:4888819-Amphidinium_carterae.1
MFPRPRIYYPRPCIWRIANQSVHVFVEVTNIYDFPFPVRSPWGRDAGHPIVTHFLRLEVKTMTFIRTQTNMTRNPWGRDAG